MVKYVLIVDDDNNIQELLSTYLKAAGYGVIVSSDGRDALKQCVIRKPDAILMDFRMPRLDGLNALDLMTLTSMGKRIPILMMSGMASTEVIETCKRLGASDFLVKPFNPDELLKKIDFFISSGPKVQAFEAPHVPSAQSIVPQAAPRPTAAPAPRPAPAPIDTHADSASLADSMAPAPEPAPAAVYAEPPPASSPAVELVAIDRHFAQMLISSTNLWQKELVLKAIEEFTKRVVARLVDIQMAFREDRFDDVAKNAQALKEESLSLGAHQFAGLSAELEELARQKSPEGIKKVRGLREEYQRCEGDFAKLRQAISDPGQVSSAV